MEASAPNPPPNPMPLLLPEAVDHAAGENAAPSLVGKFVPYQNLRALIGYYCSIFGLVPIAGLVLGPIAFLFGIAGVTYAQAHPEHRGLYHALFAVVLGTAEFTAHVVVPLTLFIFLPEDILRTLFDFLGKGK
jgi:hypothetical protein